MAETQGFVHSLTIITVPNALACAWVGPTPHDAEILFVSPNNTDPPSIAHFKTAMLDALATALDGRLYVTAVHGDTSAEINGLIIGWPE